MSATAIQWTERTVNPLRFGRGHFCRKISPGCANCYASRMQARFGNPRFPGEGAELGIPCFVKQLGANPVMDAEERRALEGPRPPLATRNREYAPDGTVPLALGDARHGGNPEEWPVDLRVREWPAAHTMEDKQDAKSKTADRGKAT
jgi:hypothetical protein